MKYVITVASYYPHLDGVQKVTQYQAERLVQMGNEVVVITSDRMGEYKDEETHNKVKIIRVNAYNKNMLHFGEKEKFQRVVLEQAEDADALVCVNLESFSADWILPILSSIKCRKILMNHGMHDFRWNNQNISSINEFVKKILRDFRWSIFYSCNWSHICQFDKVIFLHEEDYAYNYFKRHNYHNNYVLYNAADDVFFVEDQEKKNQIINVGTYNSRKNQRLCLETFYKAKTNDWELVLIGNPNNDYYNKLIQYNNKLSNHFGSKPVQILCNIDREKTIKYINESKIYLLTSTWEAFPVSLIEAMASGAAFVSTDVGIVRHLPGGMVSRHKKNMSSLLTQCVNEKWEELGKAASVFANLNFKQETQVSKLDAILKDGK